jgi:hypothetical protein
MNCQVPWIYIVRNKDLLSQDNQYVNPNFDAEFAERQRKLKEAIREEQAERRARERQARVEARRQSEKLQSAPLNDPNLIPELNAYLSTQNNDGRMASSGLNKDQGKGDRDGGAGGAGALKGSQTLGSSLPAQSPKKQAEVV